MQHLAVLFILECTFIWYELFYSKQFSHNLVEIKRRLTNLKNKITMAFSLNGDQFNNVNCSSISDALMVFTLFLSSSILNQQNERRSISMFFFGISFYFSRLIYSPSILIDSVLLFKIFNNLNTCIILQHMVCFFLFENNRYYLSRNESHIPLCDRLNHHCKYYCHMDRWILDTDLGVFRTIVCFCVFQTIVWTHSSEL